MPKEIPLTQGLFAIVDIEDYEYLLQYNWHACKDHRTFYVHRNVKLANGKQTTVYMHQDIIGRPPPGYETDHKDGNGLNNRRSNLRNITHRQNTQNKKNIELTSHFLGVSWYKKYGKWLTQIQIGGKNKHLGYFEEELDAAAAYKDALKTIGEVSVEDL